MSQATIGQRIKFLMDAENFSIRKFARTLDVSDTNIRNYIERGSKPSSDVLEKILRSFPRINPTWLLLGDGEPFLFPPDESTQITANAEKFLRSPVVGTNHGTAYQENNTNSPSDADALKTKLALAEQEVEHLKAQLASRDALLASREEVITLLRATYNRPN